MGKFLCAGSDDSWSINQVLKSKGQKASTHKRNRKTRYESDSSRRKSNRVNDDNGNDYAAAIDNGRYSEKGVG
jgi:hypothetical protein